MKKTLGFTLIELLVVVAIISLLSSAVLASFNEARKDARATAIAQQLQEMETAFQLWGVSEDWSRWPNQNTLPDNGGGATIDIDYLRQETSLGEYLSSDPKEDRVDDSYDRYSYFANDNIYTCPSDRTYDGANIYVRLYDSGGADTVERIDEIIDEETNLRCGKVFDHITRDDILVYKLATDPTSF